MEDPEPYCEVKGGPGGVWCGRRGEGGRGFIPSVSGICLRNKWNNNKPRAKVAFATGFLYNSANLGRERGGGREKRREFRVKRELFFEEKEV